MKTVTFVTSNAGKFHEAEAALASTGVKLRHSDLKAVEIQADSLDEVAHAKLMQLRGDVELPLFVDDAGLFVDSLAGFPGVYSAYVSRTLGCRGILKLLDGQEARGAYFEAVVAYLEDEHAEPLVFKGRCRGSIGRELRGTKGFGFDPIFVPEGETLTFSEMETDAKNRLSHRGRALAKLALHLGAKSPGR